MSSYLGYGKQNSQLLDWGVVMGDKLEEMSANFTGLLNCTFISMDQDCLSTTMVR